MENKANNLENERLHYLTSCNRFGSLIFSSLLYCDLRWRKMFILTVSKVIIIEVKSRTIQKKEKKKMRLKRNHNKFEFTILKDPAINNIFIV